MVLKWSYDLNQIDWNELKELYRVAPLSTKTEEKLKITFKNSMFKCFAYDGDKLIAAGRALADGAYCSYICDIGVHPDYQGRGIGRKTVQNLMDQSRGHKKILLYANPGKEGFYAKLGFKKMNTAMALFENQEEMIDKGILSGEQE